MSGIISKQVDNENQKEKHVYSYDFLKNLSSANLKKPHSTKEDI